MKKPLTFIATAAAALAAAASGAAAHVVQPGESLWSIAQANGISAAQLAAANGLGAESGIIAGSTLNIPAATTTSSTANSATSMSSGGHVVQPGESLWSIAQANGISAAQLAAANGLSADAMLIAGRGITIPSATSGGYTATSNVAAGPQTTSERLTAGQIGDIAQEYGMSRSLVQAVGWQESGFNNAAYSSADARGIMQIIPGTWQFINSQLAGGTLNPASAADNVRAGSLYLRYLYRLKGGSRDATIGSYYQGPGRQYVLPETQRYVTSVRGFQDWFASNGK
ncbi:MAG: LysM peptidoglycan-binding domain-containing protein [Solirubrobacterales bacterium]